MEAVIFVVASASIVVAVGLWAVILHLQGKLEMQTRSDEEGRLLRSLLLAVSEARDLPAALKVTLAKVCEATGWAYGEIWLPSADGRRLEVSPVWHATLESLKDFRSTTEEVTYEPGQGLPGRVWATKRAEWLTDPSSNLSSQRAKPMSSSGLRSGLAIPVLSGEEVVAVLVFLAIHRRAEDVRHMDVVSTVASQLGILIRRRQTEEALVRSEERYRTLFNSANDAIFLYALGEDGTPERFREVNDIACRLTGYSREELLRMTRSDLMTAELRSTAHGHAERLQKDRHVVFEHGISTKGGREVPVEISAHLFAFEGRPTVLSILRDVSERRRGDEVRERLAAIVESSGDAIYSRDLNGNITTWNKAAEEIYGYKAEEVIGKYVLFVPPEREDEIKAVRATIARGDRIDHLETVRVRKDGTRVQVSVSISPVRDGAGTIIGRSVIVRDTTRQKKAEADLREANRILEDAMTDLRSAQERIIMQERLGAVGQMVTGIAHDFNNSLASILGYTELLLAHPERMAEPAKVAETIKLINTSAKDAANVVRGLREFYRPRGDTEVFVPVKIREVVEEAVAMTRPKWKDEARSRGRMIDVSTDVRDGIPVIAGNGFEIREVLTNLIFNAVDAMPQGGTIRVGARAEGESVVMTVRDNGVGMTEEVRRRCMDPFFSTKGERGTGMGLAMAYGIIRRHDGAIEIESAVGAGTTFTIRLPLKSRARGPVAATDTALLRRKLHVLVVEDEAMVRDVIREYLLDEGHGVVTAVNGRDGLEKFYADRFDLIITDRAMPEMGGDTMAAAIRRQAPSKPIIMLTGFGDMMQSQGEKPEGVNLVVGKPLTPEGLREAIRKVLLGP